LRGNAAIAGLAVKAPKVLLVVNNKAFATLLSVFAKLCSRAPAALTKTIEQRVDLTTTEAILVFGLNLGLSNLPSSGQELLNTLSL
jgi:hypothetical protein